MLIKLIYLYEAQIKNPRSKRFPDVLWHLIKNIQGTIFIADTYIHKVEHNIRFVFFPLAIYLHCAWNAGDHGNSTFWFHCLFFVTKPPVTFCPPTQLLSLYTVKPITVNTMFPQDCHSLSALWSQSKLKTAHGKNETLHMCLT